MEATTPDMQLGLHTRFQEPEGIFYVLVTEHLGGADVDVGGGQAGQVGGARGCGVVVDVLAFGVPPPRIAFQAYSLDSRGQMWP